MPSVQDENQRIWNAFQKRLSSDLHFNTTGERALYLMPIYLSLFESVMDLFENVDVTDERELERFFLDLDEMFRELLQFVEESSETGETTFLKENPFAMVACIRMIGRYLAHSITAHEETFKTLLPFMIRFSNGNAVPFLIPAISLRTGTNGTTPLLKQTCRF